MRHLLSKLVLGGHSRQLHLRPGTMAKPLNDNQGRSILSKYRVLIGHAHNSNAGEGVDSGA